MDGDVGKDCWGWNTVELTQNAGLGLAEKGHVNFSKCGAWPGAEAAQRDQRTVLRVMRQGGREAERWEGTRHEENNQGGHGWLHGEVRYEWLARDLRTG
jgi:hypothetical protein